MIKEMNMLIIIFSNKINKLETKFPSQIQNQPPQNPIVICKSFNPQKINRERRHEDQPIQSPMRKDLNLHTNEFTKEYIQDEDTNWIGY